ncbi:SpoIIE family protein phosphatase [Blastococcus sp. VKM Ac-2987]|uniref:SpoIIE family protein phosphatase n=1 Tax=Blastococcus sp. VKM Ac-2987 TaxID=3004141 RepID=UPI0022ABC10D|nr:SpoIIE family protein phosphatase [Blastococcus sp. VKM Ac-2987]MCZ2860038.1 SpoIIE family protein phosphatase [Blastococcus sp. VKM Ac-2987]
MTSRPADPATAVDAAALARCADEPIAVPGAVQPHGVLLAAAEPDLAVVVASANAAALFGRPVAGAALGELLSPDDAARLRAGLRGDLAEVNPLRVRVGGADVDVVLHRADGLLVAEWEPVPGAEQAGAAWHRRLPTVLQRLSAAATLEELTGALARDVRALTGFDRVMVYRFDAGWNGEVIAEDRRADLEPFLGLWFPAGDIPAQARALYTTNWMRLIPDAGYARVPLEPAVTPATGRPLDLAGAMLRSVSPVHLEYLANMGVAASMSISLIDRGRLWGLVACHHYAGPHRPSYPDRTAAEFLGRTASLLLPTLVSADEQSGVVEVAQRQAELAAAVGSNPRALAAALTGGGTTALDLLPAAGAAVRLGGELHLLGSTPPAERVVPLVRALLDAGVPVTDAVSRAVPEAADLAATASGVLAAEVAGGRGDFVAWFRPETLREITWGGNPYTSKTAQTDAGPRLSPRRSFDAWSETVRETSRPWRAHEASAARALAALLTRTRVDQAAEDDRLATALQRTLLLDQLPKVPGVELAARYRPSEDDVVGGDWYDLVPLPGGRVSIVLGDVAGHGLAAAAITAQLRHALRAHLLRASGPGAALDGLNEVIGALLPGELATAVVAELDPATGEVVVANAGHLPVLHASAGGASYLHEGRGPALGLLDVAGYREIRLTLAGADRLLLFSDGLVERGAGGLAAGMAELRDAVAAGPVAPQALLDAVLGALDPPRTDDVTLLGIART